MSTQNWITRALLAGGLRIIRGHQHAVVLDVNSQFTVNVGNCERIVDVIFVSSTGGYVIEEGECAWVRNALTCTVRCTGAAACNPHGLATAYANIGTVEFLLIVH